MALLHWVYSRPLIDRLFLAFLTAIVIFALRASWKGLTNGRHNGYFRGYQSSPLYNLFLWIVVLPFMLPWLPDALRARSRDEQRKETTEFIGNAKTDVVHKRGCEYEQKMSRIDDWRVPFDFIEEALDCGYHPCNFCLEDRDVHPPRPKGTYLLVKDA